jgi:hypothetical protein
MVFLLLEHQIASDCDRGIHVAGEDGLGRLRCQATHSTLPLRSGGLRSIFAVSSPDQEGREPGIGWRR